MADRAFDIRRLPGAATLAVASFVILYIPMVILVANSFNEGRVIGQWKGSRCTGTARPCRTRRFWPPPGPL